MPRIKLLLVLIIVALIGASAWQIGSAEIANLNFQEDLRDLAAQAGAHTGVVAPKSEEQEAQAIVQKAREHGIALTPQQITVRRSHIGELSTWYLAVDYTAPIDLGVVSLRLHFKPTSN